MNLTHEQKQQKLEQIKEELFTLFPNSVKIVVTVKGDDIKVQHTEDFSK